MRYERELEPEHFKKILIKCQEQYQNEERQTRLTQYVLNGDDKQTLLIDDEHGAFVEVIRRDGSFIDFPGIEWCAELSHRFENSDIKPQVKYTAYIPKIDNNRYLFLWTVQPYFFDPGDEWGYGMEEQPEILLYSFLNQNGKFTEPFRLYSIGYVGYFETKLQNAIDQLNNFFN